MKTSLLLAASLALAPLAPAAHAQSTFPDVPDNHWAAAAVRRLAEAGIVEGLPPAPARAVAPRPVASAPQAAPKAKIAARTASAQAKAPSRRTSLRAVVRSAARPAR